MPTNVNLQQIIINSIPSKEIYDQMKAQGLLEPNQLYLVEEDPSVADMSKSVYDANGVVQDAGGIVEYVAANGGKIDVIKINSTPVPIVDKAVNIDIPTELSELSDDATHRVVTDTEKAAWNAKGSYSKPSGGIPKSDLDSSVQGSLSKADSALQSFTEADPTVPDWAKRPNKPSYTSLEVGADPSGTAVAAVLAHDADANAHEELFADCLKASDQEPSTPASVNADTLENHPASYFQPTITASGILKGNGAGGISAAVAGTDYAAMINLHGRNLLDNPWFTVNQRGITSGQTITNAYCFDRWRVSNILTLTFDDDAITLTPNGTYYGELDQRLEQNLIRSLVGKTVTFSAWLKGHGYVVGYGQHEFDYADWTLFTKVLPITTDSWTGIGVRTYDANSVVQIKGGVKLELGSVSTLANDIAPNYQQELAKCQRYFLRYSNLFTAGRSYDRSAFFTLFTPTVMRAVPSVAIQNVGTCVVGTEITSINSIVVSGQAGNTINLNVTTGGGSGFNICVFSETSIDLSADL